MTVSLEYVERRMREAAQTLRRLPGSAFPASFKTFWPDVIHDSVEAYGYGGDPGWAVGRWVIAKDKAQRYPTARELGPPAPGAIDRMEEAISWLLWLGPVERRAVWFKAAYPHRDFGPLARKEGCSARTIRRRWRDGLVDIAGTLNRKKKVLDYFVKTHQPNSAFLV